MRINKFIDFPFRVKRNVNKFNSLIPFEEMLNKKEIDFICYIITNTRQYILDLKRIKLFHFKYMMYIILENMNKQNLLKYLDKVNKKTLEKYKSELTEIYIKLYIEYYKNNESILYNV